MTSSSFPDVNVWFALLVSEHVHHSAARDWWNSTEADVIGFCRFTQMGVLRLLTTAATMDQQPLSMKEAWQAYDDITVDERVCFCGEPDGIEAELRARSRMKHPSPKIWADAYLSAFAALTQMTLVTFDRTLQQSAKECLVLG